MVSITELIETIPEGKKRKYLRNNYIKGLTNYFEEFSNEELDVNDLIVINFQTILFTKTDLIKDLRLFSEIKLEQIAQSQRECPFKDLSNSSTRLMLIEYFQLELSAPTYETEEHDVISQCSLPLHDFQERIRRKVVNQMFSGNKKFLIHMPTGSGKTRTAAEIIIDFIRFSSSSTLLDEKLKIIWVAQSAELCEQAFQTVKNLYNVKGTSNIEYGHFYGDHNLSDDIIMSPAIIFCSIQKLLLHYKESLWDDIRNNNYLVVVDEAHRSVASEWVKALDSFVQNNSVNLIGLTATPGSGSNDDSIVNYGLSKYYNNNRITLLDDMYSEIAKPITYLVEREFLAEIDRIDIESRSVVLDSISSNNDGHLKFKSSTLLQLSTDAKRNASILNIIQSHIEKNHKILIFTCGTDHNKILREILNSHEILSEVVDAKSKNRESIIHEFKNGDLNVLLNYGVLTTGFDAPKTNVCIIARPIESIVMYSQMVGRILRGPENGRGNKKNTLYTIKDNLDHGDYDELFNSFNDYWN